MLRKLSRWIAWIGATGIIALAMLVGLARLLLPLAVEYQDEFRGLASIATGFEVEFQGISASWPLTGPELQLIDVSISTPNDEILVLRAGELTVGIGVFDLIRERKLTPTRVGVADARVEILREPDGQFLLQGRPLDSLFGAETPRPAPTISRLALTLEDIQVSYVDAGRTDKVVDIRVDRLNIDVGRDVVAVDGGFELPDFLGRRLQLAADLPRDLLAPAAGAPAQSARWKADLAGEELELAAILKFGLAMDVPLQSARGAVTASLRFNGFRPDRIAVNVDLKGVGVADDSGSAALYDFVEGRMEWARQESGWLLSADELRMSRQGDSWPKAQFTLRYSESESDRAKTFRASTNFIRLHDLYPIVLAVASQELREGLLPASINGDIRNLELDLELQPERAPVYSVRANFDNAGIAERNDGSAASGLSGNVVADQEGGRLEIDSSGIGFVLPDLLLAPVTADAIEGFFIWRVTETGVRVLSDSVRLVTPDLSASSRFELNLPNDGSSPVLDMRAEIGTGDATRVARYLPIRKFPEVVGKWLNRAIVAGRITGGSMAVSGELADWPFEPGDGRFRVELDVEDVTLAYEPNWPPLENASGRVIFDGPSVVTERNSATIAGIPLSNGSAGIADLRKGVLRIDTQQAVSAQQFLRLLRAVPISQPLEPTLSRVSSRGNLSADIRIEVPLARVAESRLFIAIDARGVDVSLAGLDFGFTDVTGPLQVRNTRVNAPKLSANLLGEPVTIEVRPDSDAASAYSHFISVEGVTPVDKWIDALELPQGNKFSGWVTWNSVAMIPAPGDEEEATPPLQIIAHSDLAGVASTMPGPLDKLAETAELLNLDISFPDDDTLDVAGSLERDLSFALRLQKQDDQWRLERGSVHAATAPAQIPDTPGIELSGRLERLDFDQWLELGEVQEGEEATVASRLLRKATLDIGVLVAFGQQLADAEVDLERDNDLWRISLTSNNAAGLIQVPLESGPDRPILMDMERLIIVADEAGDAGLADPRDILPMEVRARDFVLGDMRFGNLELYVSKVPDGIVASPVQTSSDSFRMTADAAWLVEPDKGEQQRSRLRFELASSDVKATLAALNYDPLLEGQSGLARADVTWPGPPSGDFLANASGEFHVEMDEGALLDVEPGGGRLLGILSVAALPRRLSLDFSDVVDEGLSFDRMQGDFRLDNGEAYTCNLGLTGSVADVGIVGRAGLAAEDYDQLAVVRPHVSNVLALGGAMVGGPGVGAAMLLISQIFRKPLSALGESYYTVSGDWENPQIDSVQRSAVDSSRFSNCEADLEQILEQLELPPDAETAADPGAP